jgi:hypothetical protein
MARKFMHDRHADLYLGSKRDDFGWCETTPQYLRCNFNYEALGTKANSGRRYCGAWCATSSFKHARDPIPIKAVDWISQSMKHYQGSRPPKTCQPTVLRSEQLYPIIANPRRRIAGVSNCAPRDTRCARPSKPLPFLLHEPRRSVFPSLSRPVPVTGWSIGLRSEKSPHRWTEPEDSTRDLRPLQAEGAEALMVEGQVG